ncbi:MAG: class I SAM-dependent methyltransferase [Candidatus Hodarchaeales archaeon]|jgi:SAM-dependent methyltransferase
MIDKIRVYWNELVYDDVKVAQHPAGTKAFFEELASHRKQRLEYLSRIVYFPSYKGTHVLEVGCRLGFDLIRFAEHGAIVTGIDLAPRPIKMAKKNFSLHGLNGDLVVMNGERMDFNDETFDLVYAHGVIQYAEDPKSMIREIYRVLKFGGEAIMMVYNRYSWLNLLSILSGKRLMHEDAPAFKPYSISGFRKALSDFSHVEIFPERFPVRTGLHTGPKASLYYTLAVAPFNLIPSTIKRSFGGHTMAKAIKNKRK